MSMSVQARPTDRRDAGGVGGDAHEFDVGGRQRAVLAIEQHPVEAGIAQHLDQLRRGKHHRATERRRAGLQLRLHPVRLHRMSPRKISSRRRSAGAGDEYRGF
jgi:hypothetical protein